VALVDICGAMARLIA